MFEQIQNYILANFDFTKTLLIIILMIILGFLSGVYAGLAIRYRFFRYLAFIGIFVHELSHYLMCKLMLAKVSDFAVELDHGYVVHSKPRVPLVGKLLISLAPYFTGLFLLTYLVLLMADTTFNQFLQLAGNGNYKSIYDETVIMIGKIKFDYWFILYLFLFLNLLMSFVPSKKDIKNIIFGLVLYFILAGFFWPAVNQILLSSLIIAIIFVLIGLVIVGLPSLVKLISLNLFNRSGYVKIR